MCAIPEKHEYFFQDVILRCAGASGSVRDWQSDSLNQSHQSANCSFRTPQKHSTKSWCKIKHASELRGCSSRTVSATTPKISLAASADTPLQTRDEPNDSSEKRFLRREETAKDEEDSTDLLDEERAFQVQGLQKIIKRQQALTKKFTQKEREVFKKWMEAGENPVTMYTLFGLNRNPLRKSDPNYPTWRKFSRYFNMMQKKTKTA